MTGNCDVALVVGARLNWLLHFGEPLNWNKHVKDYAEEEIVETPAWCGGGGMTSTPAQGERMTHGSKGRAIMTTKRHRWFERCSLGTVGEVGLGAGWWLPPARG